ncbi:BC1881 family protein [Bacillus toyonensis]
MFVESHVKKDVTGVSVEGPAIILINNRLTSNGFRYIKTI